MAKGSVGVVAKVIAGVPKGGLDLAKRILSLSEVSVDLSKPRVSVPKVGPRFA